MASRAFFGTFKRRFCQLKSILYWTPHQDFSGCCPARPPCPNAKDLILLDPSASTHPLAINPLEVLPHENAVLKVSNLVELFSIIAQGPGAHAWNIFCATPC